MPGRNGQGPLNQGPMTGRGHGSCCGGLKSGAHMGYGRGMHKGLRMHNGMGRNCCVQVIELTPQEQKEELIKQKAFLENEIQNLQNSIDEL